MINYPTIVKYVSKLFAKQFLVVSAIIICVLFITSAFDILQKFKSVQISPVDFWQLIAFKIPFLFGEVSNLVCFIATLLFLRSITKNNEMLIFLSSGIPTWRIFIMPIIVTFIIGLFILAILNPIGAWGLREYEKLESNVKGDPRLNFVVSQSGIFFFERFAENHRIIQAKSINAKRKSLEDVTILVLDKQNSFIKRIDALEAILEPGAFRILSPNITLENDSQKLDKLELPTRLSIDSLMRRFTPPEMIPIWDLSGSIEKFSKSGLAITRYQIHYYKQLFKPLAMVAMAFVACWFLTLNLRDNSGAKLAFFGLILGMCTYFFLEMALRILTYSGLPPALATMLPILFIILISNFVILHFQEA